MTVEIAVQLVVASVVLSLTYSLLAIGMTVIFGIMDIINFAHGDFFMLGAYATFFLLGNWGVNFFLTLIVVMALLGMFGMVVEKVAFYRLRKEPLYGLIVAMGLSIVIRSSIHLTMGPQDRFVAAPYRAIFAVLGTSFSLEKLLPALVALALTIGSILFIQYTKAGKMMRAVSQDPDAAMLHGISIGATRLITFAIASSLAGAAGALIATLQPISPSMGLDPLIKGFAIIVIGGMGSISGAVVGSLLMGFLDGVLSFYIGSTGSTLLAFGFFIAILAIRPKGFLGRG